MTRPAAVVTTTPPLRRAAGSDRRRVRTAALAIVTSMIAAGVGLAVTASPSAASSPQCNGWTDEGDQGYMPTAPNGSTSCWLAQGSNNPGVWALQMALVHCYYEYVGPNGPDSDYGSNTYAAMKDVERRFLSSNPDVKVDGVYGPQMAGLMAFYGAC